VQLPVVRPRGSRDSQGELCLEMLTCGAHSVLLRVTPSIPGTLDGALNEL
jgi:hypothetical protein